MRPSGIGASAVAVVVFLAFSQAQAEIGDLIGQYPNPGTGSFPYAIAATGNTVAASNYWESKVYIFDADTGILRFTLTNPGTGGEYGRSLAISGNLLAVGADRTRASGASNTGAVYLYDITSGGLLHTFTSPSSTDDTRLGYSVAFAGGYVLGGAWGVNSEGGEAYLFDPQTGGLVRTIYRTSSSGSRFGYGVAAIGDDPVIMASTGGPTGQLFDRDTGSLLETFAAPSGTTGFSSISSVGGNVLIGSNSSGGISGQAYVFDPDTGALLRTLQNPHAGGRNFGAVVTGIGSIAAINAVYDDPIQGTVGLVDLIDSRTGQLLASVSNPDLAGDKYFGNTVGAMGVNLLAGGGSTCTKAYLFVAPEPATLSLLALGGVAMMRRKGRW